MSSDLFKFRYFVNCSQSLCETPLNFFGSSVGVCDQATQLCVCPPGFSGADVWAIWNDCHVDVRQREGLEYAVLALALLSLVVSFSGLIALLVKWGIIHWPNVDDEPFTAGGSLPPPPSPRLDKKASHPLLVRLSGVASSPRPTSSTPTSAGTGASGPSPLPLVLSAEPAMLSSDSNMNGNNRSSAGQRKSRGSLMPKAHLSELFLEPRANGTNSFQQLQAEQKRRRNTAGVLATWVLCCSSIVVFALYRVLYHTRIEENNHLMLMCMGSAVFFTLFALWLQAYTWFSNLPSLRLFAGMFPKIKDNLLVKYPSLLRNVLIINALIFFFMCELCWWILPAFVGFDGQPLAQLIFTLSAVEVLFFLLVSNSVSMILISLFRTFEGEEPAAAPHTNDNAYAPSSSHAAPSGGTANAAASNYKPAAKRRFTNGEMTVKSMIFLTSIAAPFFAVWMLLFAWVDVAFQFAILFFCGLFLAATMASMVSTYIFVFRMSGVKSDSASNYGGGGGRNRTTTISSRHAQRQSKKTSQQG